MKNLMLRKYDLTYIYKFKNYTSDYYCTLLYTVRTQLPEFLIEFFALYKWRKALQVLQLNEASTSAS